MKLPRVFWGMFCLAVGFGCSVKEDRDLCPCRLVLDFSDVDTSVVPSAEIHLSTRGGFISVAELNASDFSEPYVRNVPRSHLRLNVWYGMNGFSEIRDRLVIPYGMECPEVYMHYAEFDTSTDQYMHEVVMRKNHCVVTFNVEGAQEHPYSLRVRGNVNGYRYDGYPLQGEFACVAYPDENGISRMILPRQTDDSLLLDIDDGSDILKTFALGEYIAASGYDWNVPDLPDISLDLEYYLTHMVLTVQGWNGEYVYNIVL